MSDLSTTYLGLRLANPLVASPGPLNKGIHHLRHLEEAGVAAVVLHSLFEEQIEMQNGVPSGGALRSAQSLSYFDDVAQTRPDDYLEHLRRAKEALGIPVLGSLNGFTAGSWTRYAGYIQDAGADALEVNLYYMPDDLLTPGYEVERMHVELVREIRANVRIPVAVKLGPFFSSVPNIAYQLWQAGAEGVVLFNRFYQPDFNSEDRSVQPTLQLSDSSELLMRLHWTALLHGRLKADIAVTGGVNTPADVGKAILAGANVAMMTSALLREGIEYASEVRRWLAEWVTRQGCETISQLRGVLSAAREAEPAAFERAAYMRVLAGYDIRTSIPIRLDEDRVTVEAGSDLSMARKLALYEDLYR